MRSLIVWSARILSPFWNVTVVLLVYSASSLRHTSLGSILWMELAARAAARISPSCSILLLYTLIALHILWTWQFVRGDRNMIGVVKRLCIFFFAHPKRRHTAKVCRTRWIERIDALDRINKLYSSIVACFESISAGMWSPDSITPPLSLALRAFQPGCGLQTQSQMQLLFCWLSPIQSSLALL